MSRFTTYIKDTYAELKHVSWPTKQQALVYTILVIVISVLTALFTGGLDYVFTRVLDWFIN